MNLLDFKYDRYSTTGNDGIIEKIFNILSITKGSFVEFGAWDGMIGSNCRKLYEEGWSGIFIEANKNRYQDLIKNYEDDSNIICINSFVDIDKNLFDDIIDRYVDKEIDFCSIDIDGLDVEVFKTFSKHLPKVVCIEGGQMLHPYHSIISNAKAKKNIQQSLSVMSEVFISKGYRLICSYQDAFYVKKDYYNKFDVSSDLMDMYLDGLKYHARRIPWIRKKIKKVGLSNSILDIIVNNSNFKKYGYSKRRIWAIEDISVINDIIENIRKQYYNDR